MTRIIVSRRIDAPLEIVFGAVADVERLPETNPDIVRVEFLSSHRRGVGTRFRETRTMNGKEATTELEITELDENRSARMVADSHGTVWDTLFSVQPSGNRTELTITMDATPHRLLPRLLNPIMKGLFRKGIEKHIDAVRAYCESPRAASPSRER